MRMGLAPGRSHVVTPVYCRRSEIMSYFIEFLLVAIGITYTYAGLYCFDILYYGCLTCLIYAIR